VGSGRKSRAGQGFLLEVEMKFVLVVLVAMGFTMAWQASVVADNNHQQTESPAVAHSLAAKIPSSDQRHG
jgi:hypothetical protein